MGMVAPQQRIASAFFVFCGQYGDVSSYALERGVCRQWVYREAAWVTKTLTSQEEKLEALRAEVKQLRQSEAALRERLASAVVIDADKQAEVASVGQARGVTLRDCHAILDLLIPGKVRSVASLGRATQAAGKKAGELLAVLDEAARSQVREAAADEIYVKDPVLMVVEPESLCWLSGQLSAKVDGQAWKKQFARFPSLEQVMRDGGNGLANGAWKKAERAMAAWQQVEGVWRRTKEALRLHTPTGELNTRCQAEAELTATMAQLPESDFAKVKRQLHKPEMLNYLDRVHEKLAALAIPEEVKQAAVRQEGLRRRPEALQGDSPQAAVRRGILLMCAVVLSKADVVGVEAVAAVRDIFRRAYRASSLVECINSVLRMHQAGHRQMTQGLLDLKRLHWNCHRFTCGRRRKTTPYERLGLVLPAGFRWWDMLKLTPEQLQEKLSTAKMAA